MMYTAEMLMWKTDSMSTVIAKWFIFSCCLMFWWRNKDGTVVSQSKKSYRKIDDNEYLC